ncbi:unnamed protein product [Coregonus sp. 'balchen']|nr:unnamed protein product [Coregonus sp. 'balchen']
MELEGQWWKGQLAGDIYQALRYKVSMLSYFKSPQLNLRRYFADLIAIVSNRYRLCPAARHLAVYLLDLFMDRYDITVQQLHMVALSCLLLASKFEEREDRVPKLETLNSLGCMSSMNLVLTKQGLLHMELLLLETFQWNLYLPTAAHFIEYYLSIAVNDADLHDGWPMACLEKTVLYMTNAHDSDVKEANKQTCQPPGQQPGQTGYHTPCQTTTTMPPQYLHQSSIQYPQQALQPSLAPGHGPASYISATLQGPGAPPHSHPQTISAALDGKANIPSRAYQVNMHYTCAAPCFDR